jgi:hypothetical protein
MFSLVGRQATLQQVFEFPSGPKAGPDSSGPVPRVIGFRSQTMIGPLGGSMRSISLLASCLILALASPLWGGEEFPWKTDLAAAEEQALAENKPLLVVFRCLP